MHLKVNDVLLWVVGGRLQGNNQSFKSERIGPRLSYSSTSSDRPQAHALPCLGVPTRLRGPRPTRRALYRLVYVGLHLVRAVRYPSRSRALEENAQAVVCGSYEGLGLGHSLF